MSISWDLAGNGGTDSGTNFVGTTDSKSLVFKTGNTRRFVLDTDATLSATLRLNASQRGSRPTRPGGIIPTIGDGPVIGGWDAEWVLSTSSGELVISHVVAPSSNPLAVVISPRMVLKEGQFLIQQTGNFGNAEESISQESLVVRHSQNGLSPAITYVNDGGGHFLHQFSFTNPAANLPDGIAANLWVNWSGLVVTGQRAVSFTIGSLDDAKIANEVGVFAFNGGDVHVLSNLNVDEEIRVKKNVIVDGDVVLTGGADCAEEFDCADTALLDPGDVLVMGIGGSLERCTSKYSKKAVGVASGAGRFKPAITLDRRGDRERRVAVALMGKVYCKVDAEFGAISTGDLLTTSPTPGHAMLASDSSKAFGAVIGKALESHSNGRGLIPMLAALQ